MKIQLISLSLVTALIGCVEVQDQEKQTSPESTAQVAQLSYEIEALAQPQAYLVRFAGVDCNQNLKKSTQSKSDQIVKLSECSEVIKEPGVQIYHFAEGVLQVDIPKDIVINGHVRLMDLSPLKIENNPRYSQHLKISGRLYFNSGSHLSTSGESVLIEARSVHSDGGRIITFFDDVDAKHAQNGKHGGLIHLITPKIQGSMEVVLKGQNGGGGEPGGWSTGKKVKDLIVSGGNGGNSGQFWLDAKDDSMSLVKVVKIPGQQGIGVEIKSGCQNGNVENCIRKTLRPKGADGHPGMEERSCLIKNNECTNFSSN